MRVVFEGDTPYFPLTVYNSNGTIIDVTNKSIVTNLVLILYSIFDPKKVLARFALYRTGEYADYEAIDAYSDNSLGITLPKEGVEKSVNQEVVLQMTLTLNTTTLSEETGADYICKVAPKY